MLLFALKTNCKFFSLSIEDGANNLVTLFECDRVTKRRLGEQQSTKSFEKSTNQKSRAIIVIKITVLYLYF